MDENIETCDLYDVEIFSTGTWEGSNTGAGGMTFTENDLDEIVKTFNSVGDKVKPRLILGHDKAQSEDFTGYPALGWFTRLYRDGKGLYGDIKAMPKKIKEVIEKKMYGRFSPGIWKRMNVNGADYKQVLDHVALLGSTLPANMDLDGFVDLYKYENNNELVIYNIKKEEDKMEKEQFDVKVLEFEKTLEQIRDENKILLNKIADLEKEKTAINFAKRESEIKSYLEGKLKEGKITPAQMPDLMALALDSDELVTFEFKDGDKISKIESKRADLVKKIIENNAVVNFNKETSEYVEPPAAAVSDDDVLEADIQKFMKENKVDYKEAFKKVSRREK